MATNKNPSAANSSTPTKRVLIVEDERSIAQALSIKFAKQGYAVTVSYDGEGALAKMKECPFDAVILDLLMPRKNGYDVLRERLQTQNKATPVFVLSALGAQADIDTAQSFGVEKYFIKSQTSMKEVVSEIAKVV